jgi:hypothetical protein
MLGPGAGRGGRETGNRICAGETDRVEYNSQQEPGGCIASTIIGRSAEATPTTPPTSVECVSAGKHWAMPSKI